MPHARDELATDTRGAPRRRRILLAYRANPITTATYIERALRRRHDVVTWGPAIGRDTLAAWDLGAIRSRIVPTNLGYRTRNPGRALARARPGWRPDLFLWIETGDEFALEGLDELGCRTACYLIDTHVDEPGVRRFARHLAWARRFDLVFLAQRAYVAPFRAEGLDAHWLPLGCDPETHAAVPAARIHPIAFAGSLIDPRRVQLLDRLAARFPVVRRRCFLEDMTALYSRARMVFNAAAKEDLNMRVFEAMAAGALLLTDPAPGSGLEELFPDGELAAIYRTDAQLLAVAGEWLRDRGRAEAVARRAQREVLARHTYWHRVARLERVAFGTS